MGEILFLAHRMPFPPDRGDKIRSHHVLRHLATLAPVHVGSFAETAADAAHAGNLARLAASHCVPVRRKPLPVAGVEALLRRQPVSLTAFRSRRLARWVGQTLAARPIAAVFVFSGQMGQYIPRAYGGRVIVDLCDVDSAKFDAYADLGQRAWLNRREGRLLAREEQRLAQRADTTFFISAAEAALFRARAGAAADTARIAVMANGVDTAYFDPQTVRPHPALPGAAGPHLVFTGQMDYSPNIDAVRWVTEKVMPRLRPAWPEVQFHIVGRAPSAAVRALDGQNGTRVWGEVPDVRPFLAAADAVLAPLDVARGVQNKVLEAMAMARPVVLSPQAATGIGARDGEHLSVAPTDPAAFAAAVDKVLANPGEAAAMGRVARYFVRQNASWDAALRPLSHALPPL